MSDRMVLEPERKRITGVGRSSWAVLEANGEAPRRRLVLGSRVGWLESELVEWLRSRPVGAPPAPWGAMQARGLAGAE